MRRNSKDIIRVVMVDDHPVIRRGIVETLNGHANFSVVGEGASSQDATRLAQELRPDLCIVDVNMPGNGIEAVRKIRSLVPETHVVVLSFRDELATVAAAQEAGASAYILKGLSGDELIEKLCSAVAVRDQDL